MSHAIDDLKLTRQFLNAIEDAGYENATPIQQKAIPPLRAGQDVIGIAQTGTGKTAAFLLPLLQTLKYAQGEAPRGLVLAPTKELVVQIHQEALKFASYTDLRIVAFYGGVGPKKQIEEIADGVDLIVSTPGRFLEIYSRGHVETKKLKHIVLDEADRMMDMGFMPQIRQIQEVIPTKRQNILFSATFPPRVERLAEEFLLWPTRIEVTPESTPVSTVTQYKLSLPNLRTKIAFIEWYVREQLGDDRLLIFTRRKEEAKTYSSSSIVRLIRGSVRCTATKDKMRASTPCKTSDRCRANPHCHGCREPWHRRSGNPMGDQRLGAKGSPRLHPPHRQNGPRIP